ncbi:MAG: tyrosine-type recombinase/integrase, partial [Candidatus Thiodiazotropha endolucinida]
AKPWKRIKAAANLPDHFRIHDLRHTFASWGVSHGIDLYHIQALLGHSSSQMTQRYSHLAEDGIKASVKQISEKMGQTD